MYSLIHFLAKMNYLHPQAWPDDPSVRIAGHPAPMLAGLLWWDSTARATIEHAAQAT
jgi:hypothetical protein